MAHKASYKNRPKRTSRGPFPKLRKQMSFSAKKKNQWKTVQDDFSKGVLGT